MAVRTSITAVDVERSYLILALLQVTQDAADYLGDQGEPEGGAGARAYSIVAVLRHIAELQGKLHDAIEAAAGKDAGRA